MAIVKDRHIIEVEKVVMEMYFLDR